MSTSDTNGGTSINFMILPRIFISVCMHVCMCVYVYAVCPRVSWVCKVLSLLITQRRVQLSYERFRVCVHNSGVNFGLMCYKWMSVINIRLQPAAGMRLYLMDCHIVLRLSVSALQECVGVCECVCWVCV